jgi:hypothetical protein
LKWGERCLSVCLLQINQTGCAAQTASHSIRCWGSFPAVKVAVAWDWQLQFSTQVKNEWSYTLHFRCMLEWRVQETLYLYQTVRTIHKIPSSTPHRTQSRFIKEHPAAAVQEDNPIHRQNNCETPIQCTGKVLRC